MGIIGNIHVKLHGIWTSGSEGDVGPPVQWSKIINAILKEGIMENTHVKSYDIWTSAWFKHILFVYFVHRTIYKDIQYYTVCKWD